MRQRTGPQRERGAIAVVVAFSLVAMLLMIGLVLDLGHLYITKAELQSAADACALSAARELNDLSSGAMNRATAAGITVGNRHRIDLQGVDMRAEGMGIVPADVTFSDERDGTYTREVRATTRYVRCAPRETNVNSVAMWFMSLVGQADWNLSAEAVARQVGGQGPCAIPLAMCTTADPSTPNLGLVTGTWYLGKLGAGSATTGNYDWIRFEGQGAKSLGELLAGGGMCNLGRERVDAEPGVSGSAAQAWNTRFGLYSGTWNDIDAYPPDGTGFAYTPDRVDKKGVTIPGSWPAGEPQNAYANYQGRTNVTHEPFDPNSMLADNGKPVVLPGNPAPLSSALHAEKGQDRRMVFAPVISCKDWAPNKKNIEVLDYACALMLAPIDDPNTDARLEFRGLMKRGSCAGFGIPGDLGPPVPALVR